MSKTIRLPGGTEVTRSSTGSVSRQFLFNLHATQGPPVVLTLEDCIALERFALDAAAFEESDDE
jgi:hypothetical protein